MLKQVLLVEDNPGDVRLMREALRDANAQFDLHVASDGVEALAFLHQQGLHAKSPRPDLIILDLNLPGIGGRELLAHIKQHASLKAIPTVILSTSSNEADIRECYHLRANCYLVKPLQWDAFERLVKDLNSFWLGSAKLPLMKFWVASPPSLIGSGE